MTFNAKITTYACLFIIIIMFMAIALSSLSNIKSTKISSETYYTAKLIDCGNKITDLTDKLYKILSSPDKLNPNQTISIIDENEESSTITQDEIIKDEIDSILLKAEKYKNLIDQISEKEGLESLLESINYYNQATDLIISTCESIENDFENEDCSLSVIPNNNKYLVSLGNNGIRIKYYITQAQKSFKKTK